jgi:hypothetical protein
VNGNDDGNEKWLTLEDTTDRFVAVKVGHGRDRKWAACFFRLSTPEPSTGSMLVNPGVEA